MPTGRARAFLTSIPPVPPQALAAFHVSVGFAILVGGGARFSGPGFAGARTLGGFIAGPHNAWLVWGVLLLSVGLLVLFAWPALYARSGRLGVVAVAAGSVPVAFLTAGFIASVAASPTAATSGIGAYGILTLFHVHTAIKLAGSGAWQR